MIPLPGSPPAATNIVDALRAPLLFGGHPAFRDLATWSAWVVFLRACYGLPLEPGELEIFKRHTGRPTYDPPAGGWREVVAIVGRQSGKSRVAALLASFEAALAEPLPDRTATYALLVAQDHRAAMRTLFEYSASFFEADTVPLLARTVQDRKAETLSLKNGVTLAAYPCRPEGIRGLRARVVVADELAFYRSNENRPADREMLRAVRPTLATTGGRLVILSSPYGQSGALWDLHRRHFGRAGSEVLVWQASAPAMNPTLPADYLRRMEEEDPEAYRSEVLGEFRAGVAALLDPDQVDACVVMGRRELPPLEALKYFSFADPSGGSRDAFTVAVGHAADKRVIVDCVRAWPAPFNPSGVVEEAAALLKSYGVSEVQGDRYAGEWPRESFRSQGIRYEVSDLDRSALYLELLPLVNGGTIELPDFPELLRELRGLERRRGTSGRDRVDHVPGSHDDLANAVAGAAHLVLRKSLSPSRAGKVVMISAGVFHSGQNYPRGDGEDWRTLNLHPHERPEPSDSGRRVSFHDIFFGRRR
jgi:hypothetical protein